MFDNIKFETIHFSDLTETSIKHDVEDIYNENRKDFVEYINHSELSFHLDGITHSILPVPISSFSKQNFLNLDTFGYSIAGSSFFTKRNYFPYYLLAYTYSGCGELIYEGTSYEIHENQGFLIDCRHPHEYKTLGNNWHHFILHFSGFNSDWYFQQFIIDGSPVFSCNKPLNFQHNVEKLLLTYQTFHPLKEAECSLHLSTILLNIIKEKTESLSPIPDYIVYLQKYMSNHYAKSLTVTELSNFAGVSIYHLEREFKKYTGSSLKEYLLTLRLSRSCFLLNTTALPISSISQIVGFNEYNSFFKIFKKHMGMTPSEYRHRNYVSEV